MLDITIIIKGFYAVLIISINLNQLCLHHVGLRPLLSIILPKLIALWSTWSRVVDY